VTNEAVFRFRIWLALSASIALFDATTWALEMKALFGGLFSGTYNSLSGETGAAKLTRLLVFLIRL
jgi:hypothetical protein